MGNDTPLAVLSDRPQLLYNYFKQLFAQVTNPPLDAIREEIITSMITTIGSEGNLLDETPEQCRLLRLDQPVLTNTDLARIKQLDISPGCASRTLSMLFPAHEGADRHAPPAGRTAPRSVAGRSPTGVTILILSDRGVNKSWVPHAGAAGHQRRTPSSGPRGDPHPLRTGDRVGRSPRSAAFRAAHRLRSGAVNPYLALATLDQLRPKDTSPIRTRLEKLHKAYVKAAVKGLLKVMSKMGISTQQSYRGAQIFEAIGLNSEFVEEFFTWTPSRIQGVGLEAIAEEALRRHEHAYPRTQCPRNARSRRRRPISVAPQGGSAHVQSRGHRQAAARHATSTAARNSASSARPIDDQARQLLTLRGLLEFKIVDHPIPLDEVEPAAEIVKRFATGAMSYGSISQAKRTRRWPSP